MYQDADETGEGQYQETPKLLNCMVFRQNPMLAWGNQTAGADRLYSFPSTFRKVNSAGTRSS